MTDLADLYRLAAEHRDFIRDLQGETYPTTVFAREMAEWWLTDTERRIAEEEAWNA